MDQFFWILVGKRVEVLDYKMLSNINVDAPVLFMANRE